MTPSPSEAVVLAGEVDTEAHRLRVLLMKQTQMTIHTREKFEAALVEIQKCINILRGTLEANR